MADVKKKAPVKEAKKKTYKIYKAYRVENGKLIRRGGLCPKCGDSLLALHKDRKSCGKCGYTEMLKKA